MKQELITLAMQALLFSPVLFVPFLSTSMNASVFG